MKPIKIFINTISFTNYVHHTCLYDKHKYFSSGAKNNLINGVTFTVEGY